MRWFQFAGVGSQISMPIPGEVEGAPAGPECPGPTRSLTMQTSLAATGGAGVAGVPESASASPFLYALTSNTVVSESGWNSVFKSSQLGNLLSFFANAACEHTASDSARPIAHAKEPLFTCGERCLTIFISLVDIRHVHCGARPPKTSPSEGELQERLVSSSRGAANIRARFLRCQTEFGNTH